MTYTEGLKRGIQLRLCRNGLGLSQDQPFAELIELNLIICTQWKLRNR